MQNLSILFVLVHIIVLDGHVLVASESRRHRRVVPIHDVVVALMSNNLDVLRVSF
jgi:hypothetical protein